MNAKRLCRDAVLTAAALIMFMIENLFPPLFVFAPGAKIGLSNIVSLITLILIGIPDAFAVLLCRCLLGSLITGNAFALVYALPAGVVSLGVETLLYYTLFPRLSVTAISVAGAIAHNLLQLLIASLVAGVGMFPLLPLTLTASFIAGIAVGVIVLLTVRHLPRSVVAIT